MSGGVDDADLVTSALAGNDWAFERLVDRYQRPLRNLLIRVTGNPDIADDIAQETFMTAWQKLMSWRGGSFLAWLATIATRKWIRLSRRRCAEITLDPETIADEVRDADPMADLEKAILRLTTDQRIAIMLSMTLEMSHAEISHCTDWPLGTTKSHVSRAKKSLARFLQEYSRAPDRS